MLHVWCLIQTCFNWKSNCCSKTWKCYYVLCCTGRFQWQLLIAVMGCPFQPEYEHLYLDLFHCTSVWVHFHS